MTTTTPSSTSSTKRSSSTMVTMEEQEDPHPQRSVKPRMEDSVSSSACKDKGLPELDDASSYSSTTTATASPKTPTSISTTERWPAGCLSSNPLETPVLAHLYYDNDNDHHDNDKRLKLNQIVELVGVLSPSQTSTPEDHDHSSPATSSSRLMRNMHDPSSSMLLDEYDPVWNDDHSEQEEEHLPTLNVLVHRVLTMEEYGEQLQLQTKQDLEPEDSSMTMEEQLHDDDDMILQTLSEALYGSNHSNSSDTSDTRTAAHALWWTLLSQAEPQRHTTSTQYDNDHTQPAVGCASLNLVVQNGSTSSTALWQRLTQLCRHVCPVVASLDVTRAALERHDICTPGKTQHNHNRMQASPLQLPDGAIVVLHLGNLQPGVLSPTAQATLQALQQLTSQHTVDYTYDAWTTLPMRTNVRVICVSTPASKSLLPCTLNVTLNGSTSTTTMEYSPHKLTALRQYLAQARAPTSIGLSAEVLQAVQDEFCQRRQQQNSMNHTINSEQLLHVWMNGLRLEARRQGQTEATVHHLQRVLQVVDSIK